MSKTTNRSGPLGAPMSRMELIGGFLFFPVYLFLLPWLLRLASDALGVSEAIRSAVYFLLVFLSVIIIFRRWLADSLATAGRYFWETLQAAVLGFAFYYALHWLLSRLQGLFHLSAANPNDEQVAALAGVNYLLTVVSSLFLAPPAEETLFRGLIFANLRERSRVLAYLISTLCFAAAHVWQYAGSTGWSGALLAALQYLPAGVALGWTFEKADTIWAPIAVHAFLNAVSLGLLR